MNKKGPRYTVRNDGTNAVVTDHRRNCVGEVYQAGSSWMCTLLSAPDDMPAEERIAIAKRIQAWYYTTQVKKTVGK